MASAPTLAPAKTIQQLLVSPVVQHAFQFFEANADEITSDHMEVCSIPAPPFGEAERAQYLSRKLRDIGTVFNAVTDFTVRQIESKLLGPGVADDGCGLAALVALAKTLEANHIKPEG